MASGSQELERFVYEALVRGESRESIASALSAAGWRDEQTRGVLDAYADVPYVVPVPKPRASVSAREAFVYLVMFAALYFVAWHLGSLLFDLINIAWPDAADQNYAWRSFDTSMRWSVAALIITFPVFVLVARHVSKDVARHPISRLSPVRRWLTYLTLFVAATVLIGDTTVLVFNVLGGELTMRFVLKVLVVAAIAGSVFGYYLHDLRNEDGRSGGPAVGRWLLSAAAIAVVATLVASLVIVGTPQVQRQLRQDERRVADLSALKGEVEAWAKTHDAPPESLFALASRPGVRLATADPFTGEPYRYEVADARRYRLCATFATDTAEAIPGSHLYGRDWRHPRGLQCFDFVLPAANKD